MSNQYESSSSAFSGLIFGISIYFLLIVGIFLYLSSSHVEFKKFTAFEDNFLDMTFVERDLPKTTPAKKPTPVMVQKEEIVEPKIEKVEEKVVDIQEKKPQAVEEKVSVRGLFESVNARVEEIPVKQKKPTVRIQSKEKTQSSVAKDTVQNLNLDSVALVHVQSSGGKTTGEYDQYWGAISDILLQNWQITIETESGLNASVNITFDSSGKIVNFVITKLSYNNAFNAKFRSFLQKMRGFDFPKYDSNELRTYNFTFKDEYE